MKIICFSAATQSECDEEGSMTKADSVCPLWCSSTCSVTSQAAEMLYAVCLCGSSLTHKFKHFEMDVFL